MTPSTISYDAFKELMAERSMAYLRAALFVSKHRHDGHILTRPLVGELLSHSSQIEELLDSYGARNNCQWANFRFFTASIKLFSNVSYELLHIQHSLPHYRLLPVQRDFANSVDQTLSVTEHILRKATQYLVNEARRLKMPLSDIHISDDFYVEKLPPGRLPHDLATRRPGTVSKTVSLLATAFLNLAAESKHILPKTQIHPSSALCGMSGPISEEHFRSLELRFHNLQSLYDTYVSITETEVLDKDLPVLRGHISVVLHLLRMSRDFAHYYERHAGPTAQQIAGKRKRVIDPDKLLDLVINFSVYFVTQYLTCAELLCQNMLRRYTEIDRIEVNVPPYRGFHVRPSTLISKLVLHYGSEVKMLLDSEEYDAASPLELFRANEKINAFKRRSLAKAILEMDMIPANNQVDDITKFIREAILKLAEHNKLIIYDHPLQTNGKPSHLSGASLLEQVTDQIARLQVTGKIDMATDIAVTFVGDKRVLEDIKLLAQNGYGEDKFGNNIPLPEGLTYLRK